MLGALEQSLRTQEDISIMTSNGGIMLEAKERLNSTNYSTWKVRMESLLELNELMDIVVGIEERPLILQEQLNFDRRAKRALHIIKMNVTNELLKEVGKCTSSSEAWNALKKIYESKSTSRVLTLRRQIFQSSQREGESAHSFVLKVKSLNDDLACIDESIKDGELVQVMLNGLLDEHSNLVQCFAIQKSLPSVNDLQEILVAEEHRLQAKGGGASTQGGDEEALFTKGKFKGKWSKQGSLEHGKHSSSLQSRKQDKSKFKCFYCGVKGHFANECHKKQNARSRLRSNVLLGDDNCCANLASFGESMVNFLDPLDLEDALVLPTSHMESCGAKLASCLYSSTHGLPRLGGSSMVLDGKCKNGKGKEGANFINGGDEDSSL